MFSCRVVKKDDAIWYKHMPYDIAEYCTRFEQGEEFIVYINGEEMRFTRMRDGTDGRPTPGIKAALCSKSRWNEIPRGSLIRIGIPD